MLRCFKNIFLLWTATLAANVKVYPDPAQWFNDSENYANRIVYFFLQKLSDGSVVIQIQPPPFYPNDYRFFEMGTAYIDAETVIKNYSAEEVAELNNVDITFTVSAYPNPNPKINRSLLLTQDPNLNPNIEITTGYRISAVLLQWMINLDPRSIYFYNVQSTNITTPMGLNALFDYQLNVNNGDLTLYSSILDFNYWLGYAQGVFLSDSYLTKTLYETTDLTNPMSKEFTLRVDFTKIPTLATGTYSMYFVFQMNPFLVNIPFIDTLQRYSDEQVIQINDLYNRIIGANSYIVGVNNVYNPLDPEIVIINNNKDALIKRYTDTLAAMTIQWNGYANEENLTSSESSLINSMLNYIATAETKMSNFALSAAN